MRSGCAALFKIIKTKLKKQKSPHILITGVSTGIGYGCVQQFLLKGYRVIGSVRNQADADKLKKEFGDNFTPIIFDVTDAAAVKNSFALVEKTTEGKGLCGLINNAGIALGGNIQDMPVEKFRQHFEVNVFGLFYVTQTFLPLLGACENHPSLPGKIINISSVNGKIATPFVGAYVASKHAVEGLSHSLRRELLMYDIDVVIVAPGPVQTPIWEKGMDITGYENSAYYSAFKKMTTYLSGVKHQGLTIEGISKTILNIFEKEKPRTRYALLNGKFANLTIPRLLPDRVLDNIFGKQLGFKK